MARSSSVRASAVSRSATSLSIRAGLRLKSAEPRKRSSEPSSRRRADSDCVSACRACSASLSDQKRASRRSRLTPRSPPVASTAIRTPPARPTMTIADAAHGVGHPHFYFLPPLVPNPSFSGTFDPTLGPLLAVDVCRVDAGACVTPLIASFTSSGGATSASVRLDAAAEWYSVNWNTKAAALDPSQTYRIRVSVAGLTIGYADVDVVESGSELKNVQTGEFVGLLDGRTLPIKFRIERDPAIIAHVLHSQTYTAGQVA